MKYSNEILNEAESLQKEIHAEVEQMVSENSGVTHQDATNVCLLTQIAILRLEMRKANEEIKTLYTL